MNNSSILIVSLADVSKNCILFSFANSFPCSVDTCLRCTKSHLFPTKNRNTFSFANLYYYSII